VGLYRPIQIGKETVPPLSRYRATIKIKNFTNWIILVMNYINMIFKYLNYKMALAKGLNALLIQNLKY
jgi:hypothetical protein